MDLNGFRWIDIEFKWVYIAFLGFGRDFNHSVVTILNHKLAGRQDGGRLAGQKWIYMVFPWIYIDL